MIQVSDRVAYSPEFRARLGTCAMADRHGRVTKVSHAAGQPTLVRVEWNDGSESSALSCNLKVIRRYHQ